MNQLTLDLGVSPSAPAPYTVAMARAEGEVAGQRAADRAERLVDGFRDRAEAFVLEFLARSGTASGEEITDSAKRAGVVPPDDRAFGPIYAALARRGLIVFAGFCPRRKGHGTAGGGLWRVVR